MTITRSDGTEVTAIHDAADAVLVALHRWHVTDDGYVARQTSARSGQRRRTIFLHHEILGVAADRMTDVDHIDGNTLDNRRANLRLLPHARNTENLAVINCRGTSRFRGVSWDAWTGRWVATVHVRRRKHNLGRYETENEAASVVAAYRADNGILPGY